MSKNNDFRMPPHNCVFNLNSFLPHKTTPILLKLTLHADLILQSLIRFKLKPTNIFLLRQKLDTCTKISVTLKCKERNMFC